MRKKDGIGARSVWSSLTKRRALDRISLRHGSDKIRLELCFLKRAKEIDEAISVKIYYILVFNTISSQYSKFGLSNVVLPFSRSENLKRVPDISLEFITNARIYRMP